MSKHTPGPWHVERVGYHQSADTVFAGATEIATAAQHSDHPAEDPIRDANARLIAAAPDLLEACEASLDIIVASRPDSLLMEWERIIADKLRDAIFKAKGN